MQFAIVESCSCWATVASSVSYPLNALHQRNLGIARNVLQTRLTRLLDNGVLEKRLYQERPARYEYRLTEKGLDLWPTIVSLLQWGDRYASPAAGPPVLLEHRDCGGAVDEHRICRKCGAPLQARDVVAHAGPGASPDHPLRRRAERQRGVAA